jgi:hypothetical protein
MAPPLNAVGPARRVLSPYGRAAFTIRLDFGFDASRRAQATTGLMLLRFRARDAGTACLSLAAVGPNSSGGRAGTFRWLGGDGAAASITASGPMRVLLSSNAATVRLIGTLQARSTGHAHAMPGACRRL